MATAIRPQALQSGPWRSVFNTVDPFDDNAAQLLDAVNCYIEDPVAGSGVYQRPGFELLSPVLGGSTHRGQGVYTHIDLDGTPYRFLAATGFVYRQEGDGSFTDVTPVGVVISANNLNRLYFASLNGVMVVSDGAFAPWVASNLSSTPITGAHIEFSGGVTNWSALGPPVVYGGAGFFIVNQVSGTEAQSTLAWSEPGDWTVGYQQTGFDNTWTLEQTGTAPLTCLAATNLALYYFRARSIGTIAGTVGPDLQSTATHDAIAQNVGTLAPAAVKQFGDAIFFVDTLGRPYLLRQGGALVEIWKQLPAVIDAAATGFPNITATAACAAVEPNLNKYVVAIWSYSPARGWGPIELQVFDGLTGAYEGRWQISGDADGDGCVITAVGVFLDDGGRARLIALGSEVAAADIVPVTGSDKQASAVWGLSIVGQAGEPLTTEDGDTLTTEDDDVLITEGEATSWLDDDEAQYVSITTQRLGYSEEAVLNADLATIITGTDTPVQVRAFSTTAENVLEGTPTPPASLDDTFRLRCGLDLQGRGIGVAVVPQLAADDTQWSIQRVTVRAVPSLAVEDA